MFFSNVQFATIYEKNVSYEIQPNERNFHSIIKRSTQNDYYMSEKKKWIRPVAIQSVCRLFGCH